MTESEWLASGEPWSILHFLQETAGRRSNRKVRLFTAMCFRRVWRSLDEHSRRVVESLERYADGSMTLKALAAEAAGVSLDALRLSADPTQLARRASSEAARTVVSSADRLEGGVYAAETDAQAGVLRDIFGNPFRPASIDPAWLTPAVSSLAQAAYDERIKPSGELDIERLAVLSDCLEETGCDNEDILNHLRSPGPHVRGCWCVDLLLGKG
jgi:hypothetical protein